MKAYEILVRDAMKDDNINTAEDVVKYIFDILAKNLMPVDLGKLIADLDYAEPLIAIAAIQGCIQEAAESAGVYDATVDSYNMHMERHQQIIERTHAVSI